MQQSLRFGILLFFCLSFFGGFGQDSTPIECGTRSPTKQEMIGILRQEKAFKQSLGSTTNLVGAITVYIKFHNVLNSDGTGRNIASSINNILSYLDQKYASVNINFEQGGGIDYIYSSNYYNFYSGCSGINDEANLRNGRDATNAINIYFVGTIKDENCSFLNGYAYLPTYPNPKSNNTIVIRTEGNDWSNTIIPETIPHEMGHYFNLHHTFDNIGGNGDLVNDTPFDPNTPACVSPNCNWYLICSGNPDVRNLMSYYHGCRIRFTSGQYQRMEDYGKTYRTNLNSDLSQRYYLDGLNRTILRFSAGNSSLTCAGSNLQMKLNSYGEPSFCQGTFYLQMKPANGYFFANINSTGFTSTNGEVEIMGTIPSNTPAGYYQVRICKVVSESLAGIEETTVYINGTTNNTPTGSPISSLYALATTTLYNATSTCIGNNIGLYGDLYGYDSYWWTKDGLNLTASSTNSYFNASSTGIYTLKMMKCGNVYSSSNTIYLTFFNTASPTITASAGGISSTSNLNICNGTIVSLSTNCQANINPLWGDGGTSSIRYVNASSTTTYTAKCSNYFCTSANSPPVRIVNEANIQSTKSGNWQDPTMWTNNFVPLNCQTVTIQAGHTVNVPVNDAKAKNIIIKGNLNFQNTSPTVKGKVGLGI
jgi:Pregnancy-associated plasma protein-A